MLFVCFTFLFWFGSGCRWPHSCLLWSFTYYYTRWPMISLFLQHSCTSSKFWLLWRLKIELKLKCPRPWFHQSRCYIWRYSDADWEKAQEMIEFFNWNRQNGMTLLEDKCIPKSLPSTRSGSFSGTLHPSPLPQIIELYYLCLSTLTRTYGALLVPK